MEFAHHLQRSARESSTNLYTRISERWMHGIRVINASDILDIGVVRMVKRVLSALLLCMKALAEKQRCHES